MFVLTQNFRRPCHFGRAPNRADLPFPFTIFEERSTIPNDEQQFCPRRREGFLRAPFLLLLLQQEGKEEKRHQMCPYRDRGRGRDHWRPQPWLTSGPSPRECSQQSRISLTSMERTVVLSYSNSFEIRIRIRLIEFEFEFAK